jgi:hypothetical protein
VGDYVAGFLGLAEGNAWSMNAFDVRQVMFFTVFIVYPVEQPIKLQNEKVVHRGEGNHVSVEFNLLYRVCSTLIYYWTMLVTAECSGTLPFQRQTRSGPKKSSLELSAENLLTRYVGLLLL